MPTQGNGIFVALESYLNCNLFLQSYIMDYSYILLPRKKINSYAHSIVLYEGGNLSNTDSHIFTYNYTYIELGLWFQNSGGYGSRTEITKWILEQQ